MRFSTPSWLLAGLLTGIGLVLLWRWHDVRQQAALARFVAAHLRLKLTGSVSRVGRFVQRALLLGSLLSLFAALAGPQLGYHWEQIHRRGNEVVFALDTSRSMLTPDVRPDRLTRAKLAIDDMARQLEGDGIGIVAFAGSAFLVCPLTFDYGAFHQSLDAIDVHTIARGGTNIAGAIEAARGALRQRTGSDRILILVTDGENLEGDGLAAAKEASSQDGLKIYTVGVGTSEGELIPLPPDQGGGFVKDEAGALVKSHLDEAGLQAIASATGGTYVRLGRRGDDFETFLRTIFAEVSKHDLRFRQQRIYTERYQWPLAASVAMLLASLMVGTRRGRRSSTAAGTAAVVFVAAVMFVPAHSHGADQTADIKAPRVQYNVGTSAYRAGQFSKAAQAFQQSIKTAPASDARRLADQEDAYYNLGNALYREGQQSEKTAPQEAIRKWTAAVKAYDTALQLHADDADSRHNRDFVQRKIDALQQPPKQGGGGSDGGNGGGQGRGQGQPPPQGHGQPPPGQTPPRQQGEPPPGRPPPQQQDHSPSGRAPPQQAQTSPGQTLPQDQSTQPPPPQQVGSASGGADRRAPAQMSADEARDLLDSAKSDERHSLQVPTGPRDPKEPDKPLKNW